MFTRRGLLIKCENRQTSWSRLSTVQASALPALWTVGFTPLLFIAVGHNSSLIFSQLPFFLFLFHMSVLMRRNGCGRELCVVEVWWWMAAHLCCHCPLMERLSVVNASWVLILVQETAQPHSPTCDVQVCQLDSPKITEWICWKDRRTKIRIKGPAASTNMYLSTNCWTLVGALSSIECPSSFPTFISSFKLGWCWYMGNVRSHRVQSSALTASIQSQWIL